MGGVDCILSTPGACDFYGWKVLEGSNGVGLSIPKRSVQEQKELVDIISKNQLLPIVGHSVEGIDPRDIDMTNHKGVMVIVGNERNGPSKELLDIAVRVKIPINKRMNSLNVGVAGGLLLQLAKGLIS